MTPNLRKELSRLLAQALQETLGESFQADVESSFEIPREEKFGDISTHIVLKIAKEKKTSPRPLADKVSQNLQECLKNSELVRRIIKVAVEGPGFINFYYSQTEISSVLFQIKKEGRDFGRPEGLKKKNILLEFVSANPTGPLTVAHGRQAALGDSLARIFKFCGHQITKEYYNNDEGVQINTLGRSIRSRYLQLIGVENAFPQDGYKGEYIGQLAQILVDRHGKQMSDAGDEFFSRFGKETIFGYRCIIVQIYLNLRILIPLIRKTLGIVGVRYESRN